MKKSKNIMKETGIWLIAGILILTAIIIVPTTMAQPQHDVGVTEIISPTSGPLTIYPVEVKVTNFGLNTEIIDVQVEIIEIPSGAGVYAELAEDVYVPCPGDVVVTFPDWMPSSTGKYEVCGFTILDGDQNSGNDKTCVEITIDLCDIEIEKVWGGILGSPPTLNKVKANIKNNGMDTIVSWDFSFSIPFTHADNSGVTIAPLPNGNSITVSSKFIIWGTSTPPSPKTVTITATAQCGDQDVEIKNLLKPGLFLWLVY